MFASCDFHGGVVEDSVLIMFPDVSKGREQIISQAASHCGRTEFVVFGRTGKICDLSFCEVEYAELQYVYQTTRRHTKTVISSWHPALWESLYHILLQPDVELSYFTAVTQSHPYMLTVQKFGMTYILRHPKCWTTRRPKYTNFQSLPSTTKIRLITQIEKQSWGSHISN